jgi:5-methylthioadenosine/S-adenosylhomocysteine deaminase
VDAGGVGTCDLLLTGGSVVTVDDERRVLEPGAVAIRGERIVAVGTPEELQGWQAARRMDCTGKAVIPGLIDCHNHLFQYLARGLGEGLELWPWLRDFMWPLATTISKEEARAGATLAAVEAARAGTTCILDNHYAPTDAESVLAVAEAIDSVGLRGAVARGMTGPVTPVAKAGGLEGRLFKYSIDEEIDITRTCIEQRADSKVGVWPAPLNVIYVEQDLVREAVALARQTGTGWHTHCSEAVSDPGYYLDFYGVRPVEWLAGEGLLGPDATLAHGIYFDDAEVGMVGESGTGVAYCPGSHCYAALGVMRLRDLRAAGATVGLGADGGSGHRADLFDQMKMGIYVQRLGSLDPTASNGEEVLELATREGARYMGIEAGVLASGKLADVVVVDLERPHLVPNHRTVATLAYSARGSDVVTTIVGGRVVVEEGRCALVDEGGVVEEARGRAEDLVRRSGIEALREPWRQSPEGVAHAR